MSKQMQELALSNSNAAPDCELCGHSAAAKHSHSEVTQGCVLCSSMKKLSLQKTSERINELAVPKGNVDQDCELCGQSATTKCDQCLVTFYCSEKHKTTDWESFHGTICDRLKFLRGEHPLLFKRSEREEQAAALEKDKMDILKRAEFTCRKWLLAKNADYAYPPAMCAMNLAGEVKGPASVEIINPMCLVSEVYLGFRMLTVSKDYMTQATFVAHENEVVPSEVLIQVHRIRGLVFMHIPDWPNALESFSEFVYFLATLHGTMDIRIALGYGYLGLTQTETGNLDGGLTCFHKMADMWLDLFLAQYERKTLREATKSEMNDDHLREMEFQFRELRNTTGFVYETVRRAGVNEKTDLVMFKLLLLEVLSWMRLRQSEYVTIFREEALSVAVRTKQDKAVDVSKMHCVVEILGADPIKKWERKHIRPRTIATKYLEMVKKLV